MQPGEKFVRCLLDQKDEEHERARRLRRRTLLISIVIQALVLTLLLLRPLFGAQEVPLVARWIPLPRYRGQPASRRAEPQRPAPPNAHHVDLVRQPIWFPQPLSHPAHFDEDSAPDIGPATGNAGGEGPGVPDGLILPPGMSGDLNPLPEPPPPDERTKKGPRRVPSEIQEALLLVRVEPRYPPLARQARIQGTVEIHAIIAADGSIRSAEVVSGNVVLARAALDALIRWRYRPTVLNGQPVEVETIIRVVFKME
jgi:periplasmic protein TonB